MPNPKAEVITASEAEQAILKSIERRRNAPQWLVMRVKVILLALKGYSNTAIAETVALDRNAVRKWRGRWQVGSAQRAALESEGASSQELESFIIESLRDAYRSGTPPKFTAEQIVQIVAIGCEDPPASGYPISHWTPQEVAVEAIKRGIVSHISARQVGRFLK